ncbi:MAG: hypothetical protein EOM77_04070, partial [Bacteroidia bacterium]|nr:hypothetical protein [Bacteroidia bacterium]
MKRKALLVLPLLSILSSCVIINPVYPQDILNLDLYQDPISLDWSNDEEEEPQNSVFDDAEVLRAYLNASHAAIKEVTEQTNVYHGRGALR